MCYLAYSTIHQFPIEIQYNNWVLFNLWCFLCNYSVSLPCTETSVIVFILSTTLFNNVSSSGFKLAVCNRLSLCRHSVVPTYSQCFFCLLSVILSAGKNKHSPPDLWPLNFNPFYHTDHQAVSWPATKQDKTRPFKPLMQHIKHIEHVEQVENVEHVEQVESIEHRT